MNADNATGGSSGNGVTAELLEMVRAGRIIFQSKESAFAFGLKIGALQKENELLVKQLEEAHQRTKEAMNDGAVQLEVEHLEKQLEEEEQRHKEKLEATERLLQTNHDFVLKFSDQQKTGGDEAPVTKDVLERLDCLGQNLDRKVASRFHELTIDREALENRPVGSSNRNGTPMKKRFDDSFREPPCSRWTSLRTRATLCVGGTLASAWDGNVAGRATCQDLACAIART